MSQPSVVDSFRLWTPQGPGRAPRTAELQKAALPAPGKLLPHHRQESGGRGAARTPSAESHGGLLQEHHPGGAAGRQGEKAGHPAERREERRDDPGQKARGGGAAESPAAVLMGVISAETVCFSPLSQLFFSCIFFFFLKLYFTRVNLVLEIKTDHKHSWKVSVQ